MLITPRTLLPALLLTLTACATTPKNTPAPFTPPPPLTSTTQSAFLKPFLTANTSMILHIDTSLINAPAFQQFLSDTPPEPPTLADKLNLFTQLGGKHIYNITYTTGPEFTEISITLFPLEPNGNTQKLADFLTAQYPNDNSQKPLILSPSLLACGPPNLRDLLNKLTPSPRPEFQLALTPPSDAAQFVFAPGPDTRKLFAAQHPTLPENLGAISSDILTKSFQYLLITISSPPNPKLHILIQSDSPKNATLSAAFIDNLTADLNSSDFTDFADFSDLLIPTTSGSTVTMDLDGPKIKTALSIIPSLVLIALIPDRNSAHYLRMDIHAAAHYAKLHHNTWPPTLQTLVDKGFLSSKRIANPSDPQHRPYEYHPWTPDELRKLDPVTTPVIWEDTDDDTTPVNVGFLDGHVEKLNSKSDLTKLLSAANENLKAP